MIYVHLSAWDEQTHTALCFNVSSKSPVNRSMRFLGTIEPADDADGRWQARTDYGEMSPFLHDTREDAALWLDEYYRSQV
jgi:hypothetical protein